MTRTNDPDREFDLRMASYSDGAPSILNQPARLSQAGRRFSGAALRAALGGASEAQATTAARTLCLLAQDETTVVFALEGDVRGLEPALSYDFTANPLSAISLKA